MKRSAIVVLTITLTILIGVLACLAMIYSGFYNISATSSDNAIVNWALEKAMTRSVVRHSKGINPPPLSDQVLVREGFVHYNEMCVVCHGAPGVSPGEIAKGLRPEAPDLSKTAKDWTPVQLFWITKNGVKFTAMPAWGPTHNDEKLWAIVAFLERLPQLSPEEYRKMKRDSAGHGQSIRGEESEPEHSTQ